ncbi:MAG: hypothetical protein IPJ14_16315 [Kineosporiaceae bacterium]|nr:hypothetical protein [Kineosporiaceae bacterium]MBK7624174.1 hypothetical protein [Kineosporiaceae bacterium]MBK8075352.1 hypothetical protein [Kineosporiaceae bacterium]
MSEMTEEAARITLRSMGSPAADPECYVGTRRPAGWLFRWRPECGSPPVGTVAWVVADTTGRAGPVRLGRTAEALLDELSRPAG